MSVHIGSAAARNLGDNLAVVERLRADLTTVAQNRAGQRMCARLFCRHGVGQHLALVHLVIQNDHGNDLRLAFGHGAGLIQQHGVRTAHLLDVCAALNEHALLDRRVDRRGERRRCGELDAARIIDDQHLQRLLCVMRHQPDRQAEQEVQRHEIIRKFIRIALNGRFFQLAGFHHAHDAGNHRLIADLVRLDLNVAALDHRAREDLVARALFNRHKLAGDRALVNDGHSGGNHAVHRNLFARVNGHGVARVQLRNRGARHTAVLQHLPHVAVVRGEHFLDGRTRPLDGIGSHQLCQIRQRQNHQRGMRRAKHQARDDGSHSQEIGVRPHVLSESFQRAPCHRRGKTEARQRFQRGEIRQRAAQQRGGKERVAQHHCARVHRQPLGQTSGRHRLLSRFFLAACVACAQGGHRIACQHHIRTFRQRRGIQLVLIVLQQNTARAGRHLHAAHAGNRGQRPGHVHARVKQKAKPVNPQAKPPRQAAGDLPLHPILV